MDSIQWTSETSYVQVAEWGEHLHARVEELSERNWSAIVVLSDDPFFISAEEGITLTSEKAAKAVAEAVMKAKVLDCRMKVERLVMEKLAEARLSRSMFHLIHHRDSVAQAISLGFDPAEEETSEGEGDRFGVCPHCHKQGGYLNVGKNHWIVCDEHKVKWWVGSNLFSSWQQENAEIWERNRLKLDGYTQVKAYHPPVSKEQ